MQTGGREAFHEQLSAAILAQVGIQAPWLEFPLHLPSRQENQDSFRVRFLCAVYIAIAPVACRPFVKWKDWLYWFVSALCDGIWVQSWEEASQLQDLREDLPAP